MKDLKIFPILAMVFSGLGFGMVILAVAGQKIIIPIMGGNVSSMDTTVFPVAIMVEALLTFVAEMVCMSIIMKKEKVEEALPVAVICVVIRVVISVFRFIAGIIEVNVIGGHSAAFVVAYSFIKSAITFFASPMFSLSTIFTCIVLGIAIAYKKFKTDIYV